jgi:hypothetical protein
MRRRTVPEIAPENSGATGEFRRPRIEIAPFYLDPLPLTPDGFMESPTKVLRTNPISSDFRIPIPAAHVWMCGLVLLLGTACDSDHPSVSGPEATTPTFSSTSTPPLGPTRTWWHTPDELWVYSLVPEVGITTAHGGLAVSHWIPSLHMRLVRAPVCWDGGTSFNDLGTALQAIVDQPDLEAVAVVSSCGDSLLPDSLWNAAVSGKLEEFSANLASFVADAMTAFPQVRFWQIWNEMDTGWWANPWAEWVVSTDNFDRAQQGRNYAETMKLVYPTIKAINPEAWVLIGGLTGIESFLFDGSDVDHSAPSSWNFMRGFYENGGRYAFDFLATHLYGCTAHSGNRAVHEQGAKIRGVIAEYGWEPEGRPLWVTEFGSGASDQQVHCGLPPSQDPAAHDAYQAGWFQDAIDFHHADPTAFSKMIAFITRTNEGGIETPSYDSSRVSYGIFFGPNNPDHGWTPRPAYHELRTRNDLGSLTAVGTGSVTVLAPDRRPLGYDYTRAGGYVTIKGVQVNKLVPTRIAFEPEPPPPGCAPPEVCDPFMW